MAINRSGIASLFDPSKDKPITYGDRVQQVFREVSPIYEEVVRGTASDPEERRRQAQAQALFALAQTGLAFASPTQAEIAAGQRFSPAERLAQSIEQTKLFPTIAALGAQEQKAKDEERKAIQAARLSALSSAEQKITAETKATQELKAKQLQAAIDLSQMNFKLKGERINNEALEKSRAKYKAENLKLDSDLKALREKISNAQKLDNTKQVARLNSELRILEKEKQNVFTLERDDKLNQQAASLEELKRDLEAKNITLRGDLTMQQIAAKGTIQFQLQDTKFQLRAIEAEKKFNRDLIKERRRQDFTRLENAADRELRSVTAAMRDANEKKRIELQEKKLEIEKRKQDIAEQRAKLGEQIDLVKNASASLPVLMDETRKLKDGTTTTTGKLFAEGKLNDSETRRIATLASAALSGKRVFDGQKSTLVIPEFSNEVSQQLIDHHRKFGNLRPSMINALEAKVFGTGPASREQIRERLLKKEAPSYLEQVKKSLNKKDGEIYDGIVTSVGTEGLLANAANAVMEASMLGTLFGVKPGSSSNLGTNIFDMLQKELLAALLQSTPGRDNAQIQQIFLDFAPSAANPIKGMNSVTNKIGTLISKLEVEEESVLEAIDLQELDKKEFTSRILALRSLRSLKKDYMNILGALRQAAP